MKETFNPWLEIWTRPRDTIRKIVAENPNQSIWLLAAIYGFGSLLNNAQTLALGHTISLFGIFIVTVLLCALWGYIFFSVWSAVVYWVGKLFKGQGTFQTVRAAYAWSCVPLIFNVFFWIVLGFVFGSELFMVNQGGPALGNGFLALLFVVLISRLVLSIWSLVIYFNALAEVQQYSILKSILNVVIASILLFVGVWILWSLGIHLIHPGAVMPKATFMLWSEGFSLQTINIFN
ncbi:MAG: YIP1 family protein [Verrucomicrobia bacterium]|nr:YIP1 family protein [Verrucomicrobiota bacterium]